MNFIVGSVTTFALDGGSGQGKNPSFNVVTVDKKTLVPIDYETWWLDLEAANRDDNPQWALKYSYKRDFNLPDLSPKTLAEFAHSLISDEQTAIKYSDQKMIGAHPITSCDLSCRRILHC